jgi:hypothetical protein
VSLPGTVPAKLAEIYNALPIAERGALEEHLFGGTSAARLSDVLTRHGHQIGKTTIKVYRKNLKEIGLIA